MLFYIRYTAGLGDAAIYARLRNATGQFWDFTNLAWIAGPETVDCQVWLAEHADLDSVDSFYSSPATIPVGGPWVEEAVLDSNKRVLGYDYTEGLVDSETLNLKQSLFAYIGSASNVFSKVCGGFVGTLDFYTCSFADFENSMADPGGTFICKLNASGQMLDISNVVTTTPVAITGEVLYLKLSSSPSFRCTTAAVVNIYNAVNKGNIRCYVEKDVQYVASIGAYYPTLQAGLLVYENAQLISLGETAYGKAIGMIPSINWSNISQPVQLTTTQVIV